MRKEGSHIPGAPGNQGASPFQVLLAFVFMESGGDLNQPLKESPFRAGKASPQVLPYFMSLKIITLIE